MFHDLSVALLIVTLAVQGLVAVAGVVGGVLALMTREDAFPAGDRMPKLAWVAMLFGSAVVIVLDVLSRGSIPILPWIGIVIIGVYWFDVRPQLRSLIDGTYGY
ncbi:DUF2516 family protein [Corynebacterium uropygiale]|uniref:DUF2516 family protein n=1 Tax=Corynebacterium uropygiale TaxID=1775911 RepID=A0A9X1QQ67_9CORY|nr:DUF2516 family protein [Corynebacterium uropygiale]